MCDLLLAQLLLDAALLAPRQLELLVGRRQRVLGVARRVERLRARVARGRLLRLRLRLERLVPRQQLVELLLRLRLLLGSSLYSPRVSCRASVPSQPWRSS